MVKPNTQGRGHYHARVTSSIYGPTCTHRWPPGEAYKLCLVDPFKLEDGVLTEDTKL